MGGDGDRTAALEQAFLMVAAKPSSPSRRSAEMAHPQITRPPAAASPDWSWATVMVVDDEEINRALLAGIARRDGIGTIVQAVDGLDCLHKLETVQPDLIILDIVMPNLDGFATCARIRAMPDWADIPILVQTALTTPQDVLACFQAGASDVVVKPIRPAELTARLRVHLENRRMVRTLRDANQRIQKEMQGAREMQRTLFPSPTMLEHLLNEHGLCIEGKVEPLDGVGGDIWGLHPLSDTLVAVMVADFSGHGLMAALNTFWLHAFVSKQAAAMRQPAEFLKLLNGALRANLMRGHFATFFFGLIDLERDELHWSGAGAPKPILVLNDEFHELDTTGLPLGLTDRAIYGSHSVAFPPGAGLLVFSDGLTDIATQDGTRIEAHGLMQRLRPHLQAHPSSNLADILQAVAPAQQTQLSDDTTTVWIRRRMAERNDIIDPRHLCLSGVELEQVKWWVTLLALPYRTTPMPGLRSRPIHLIASGDDGQLTRAFDCNYAAIVEVIVNQLGDEPPEELVLPPSDTHMLVSLTTATAYRLPLAMLFCDGLQARGMVGETAKSNILLALQEAIANGVVHGNLELHSPRRAFENMRAYWAEIRNRLADPAKANRRITIDCHLREDQISITITDQGRGYNPDTVQDRDPSRPHGKGLKLIGQLAAGSDVTLGGRQHTLIFAREIG